MIAVVCGVGIVPRLTLEQRILHNAVEILAACLQFEDFVVAACTNARNLDNRVIQPVWVTVATEINFDP